MSAGAPDRLSAHMPAIPFGQLPDTARLWIFAAERELSAAEQSTLLARVDRFLNQWTAHGTPLVSGRELRETRFLFVAVDEARAGVSGCSIDALVRGLKALEPEIGVPLVDSSPVWYRDHGSIRGAGRERFTELAAAGAVTRRTPVFDTTLATVGDLRAGRWEVPAGNAWHGRTFF